MTTRYSLDTWSQEKSREKVRGSSLMRQKHILNQALEGSQNWKVYHYLKIPLRLCAGEL